jgi:hypothetical protein
MQIFSAGLTRHSFARKISVSLTIFLSFVKYVKKTRRKSGTMKNKKPTRMKTQSTPRKSLMNVSPNRRLKVHKADRGPRSSGLYCEALWTEANYARPRGQSATYLRYFETSTRGLVYQVHNVLSLTLFSCSL